MEFFVEGLSTKISNIFRKQIYKSINISRKNNCKLLIFHFLFAVMLSLILIVIFLALIVEVFNYTILSKESPNLSKYVEKWQFMRQFLWVFFFFIIILYAHILKRNLCNDETITIFFLYFECPHIVFNVLNNNYRFSIYLEFTESSVFKQNSFKVHFSHIRFCKNLIMRFFGRDIWAITAKNIAPVAATIVIHF